MWKIRRSGTSRTGVRSSGGVAGASTSTCAPESTIPFTTPVMCVIAPPIACPFQFIAGLPRR